MSTYDTYVTHPIVGHVYVQYEIDSYGSPDSYFEQGDPPEWGVTKVSTDLYPNEIRWYFPHRDYSSVEQLIESEVLQHCLDSAYDDPDW